MYIWGFPGGSDDKEFTCNAGDLGSVLSQEDPLEKGIADHSRVLAWRIQWQRSLSRYSPWDCQEWTGLRD